jgi:hypothetical protein
MTGRLVVIALGVCAALAAPVSGSAQESALSGAMSQLQSADSSTRIEGLEKLLALGAPFTPFFYNRDAQVGALLRKHPQQADQIARALIAALERETSRVESGRALTEADTELWADLVASVAALRDPRAASALAGVLQTGGMARNGLLALGAVAVAPVIDALRSPPRRFAARLALEQMIARKDAATTAAIRTGLLPAINDADPDVRAVARTLLDMVPPQE